MLSRITIFMIFLGSQHICQSYKILFIVPKFGLSHLQFNQNAAHILEKKGHNVTFLLSPVEEDENGFVGSKLAQIVHVQKHPLLKNMTGNRENIHKSLWIDDNLSFNKMKQIVDVHGDHAVPCCKNLLQNQTLLAWLKEENFDLGVTEPLFFCAYGIFKMLDITHVSIASVGFSSVFYEYFGLKLDDKIPDYLNKHFDDEDSFQFRVHNLEARRLSRLFVEGVLDREQLLFDETFGETFVNLKEQISKSFYFFSNSNPVLAFPHTSMHKIINIGGFSSASSGVLTHKWNDILNLKRKIVLISFGSISECQFLPLQMKLSFAKAFIQHPNITFIWRYTKPNDVVFKDIKNVILEKWLPQNALLQTKRIHFFIFHVGLNSLYEAAYSETPILGVPIFSDQYFQAKIVEKFKFGRTLFKEDLYDTAKLSNLIEYFLKNHKSMKAHAHVISEMLKNQPDFKDVFVKHVEFAARFGKQMNATNIPTSSPTIYYEYMDATIYLFLKDNCYTVVFLLLLTSVILLTKLMEKNVKSKTE